MPTSATRLSFDAVGFEAVLAARNEPQWSQEQRQAAFEHFQQTAWPDRRAEEWMRTDIRTFKLEKFTPASELASTEVPAALLTQGVELGGSTVSRASRSIRSELKAKWAEKGVVFCSLDEALAKHPQLVQKYLFSRAVDPQYDRFASLHAAFWAGGTFLFVPRGVTVDEPLHSLVALGDGEADFSHTLVVLEEGAEATLMVELRSLSDGTGLHCGATELILSPNSRLRFVNLQEWSHDVWHFAHQKALVGRDASLQWTIGALGSKLAKVNQHVALVGEGAESQVNGVMFTEGKQHLSYHTLQHHEAPNTRSNFLYKAALQDHSRTVWRGMIKVDPAAQKTDGYQRNDNLLLSPDARADSIPGLEIEADDVRCTHGSTSGKVDEEQIFYAQARGFTRKEATRMIVVGFFQQVFDRITIESVREALGHAAALKVREYE